MSKVKIPRADTKAPNDLDRLVGRVIRERRKHLGLSQAGLGQQIGVTFQQVQKYENGFNRVSVGRLSQIADVLDVPISSLLDDSDLVSRGKISREAIALAYRFDALSQRDQEVINTLVGALSRNHSNKTDRK